MLRVVVKVFGMCVIAGACIGVVYGPEVTYLVFVLSL